MKTKNRPFHVQTYLTYEEKRQLEKHVHEAGESEALFIRRALKSFFDKLKRKSNAEETN